MASLVLRRNVVTVDLFVALVPDTKELRPDRGECSENPRCPRVGLGMDIAMSEKRVLTYPPLGSGMPIKQMSPTNFGLFV